MSKAVRSDFLRAGELAAACGVSTDTLRHYERKGVLAARRSHNGYREYPAGSLERVRLVRRLLGIGFTLDELAQILRIRDRGDAPCREVRALAAAKLAEIEARLRGLASVRDELRSILTDWDTRLADRVDGERAELLHSLVAPAASNEQKRTVTTDWRDRNRNRRERREKGT